MYPTLNVLCLFFILIVDDIDLQFEHQLQLTQSRENVEHGIQSLKFLREDLTRAVERIATHDSELDKWLEKHEGIVCDFITLKL